MMEERMYVGIDVAKESFDLCILDSNGEPMAKRRKVPSSSNGFKELMDILHSTGDIARIRIGMESTGIYHLSLLRYLRENGFTSKVFNGIETRAMKSSRVRKSKTDAVDAEAIATALMLPEHTETYEPPENIANLREYVSSYNRISKKIKAVKNNIIRDFDIAFPGYTSKYDMLSDISIRTLSKYPTSSDFLKNIDEAEKEVPEKMFQFLKGKAMEHYINTYAHEAIRSEILSLLRIGDILKRELEEVKRKMEMEFNRIDNPIKTIPGIGPVTGSIIISKIGDIRRFDDPKKLVAYAGIDPVITQSGNRYGEASISKRGDGLLRMALYQTALVGVICNPLIKEYYQRKLDEGMEKKKALVACSRKLCHIIWKMWTDNKEFDPEVAKERLL